MEPILTRGLQVLATSRQQSIDIMLVYITYTDNNDGSFTPNTPVKIELKGFLTDLTDYEIKRLNEGGVTITSGLRLSLNYEVVDKPSEIHFDKLDTYSYLFVGVPIRYNVSEGVSVFIMDKQTLKRNAA